MNDLDPRLVDDIRRHIEGGSKIEAIKALREATGMDLAAAKDWVESFAASGRAGATGGRSRQSIQRERGPGLPAKVQGLLHSGREIEAIKALREARGCGLKEAKTEIDAYLNQHPHLRRKRSGPGMGLAVIILIALAVAGWYVSRMMAAS